MWGHCPKTLCMGFQMLAPASVSSYLMLSGRLSIHAVEDLDPVVSFWKKDSGQLWKTAYH